MNVQDFLIGLGFLIAAFFTYQWIKDDEPSSEKNDWKGPTLSTYFGLWACVVMLTMVGIAYILKSLPSQI